MASAEFTRSAWLWVGLLVLAFVSQSFWVYAALGGVALWLAGQRANQPLAVYAFVLFVIPPFSARIGGFAGLTYFFDLTHLRLLALTLLLPAALALWRRHQAAPWGRQPADIFAFAFLLLQFLLQLGADTATNSLRYAFYTVLDLGLPYYVASRGLRHARDFREVIMSFVFAALLMCPVAGFEFSKQWLLYSSLPGLMSELPWGLGAYLIRGESLRAMASAGHSLVLGYVMVVACALFIAVRRKLPPLAALLVLGGLLVGLLAPVSRGPWVGALVVFAVFMATGTDRTRRLARVAMWALPLLALLLLSPAGPRIVDLLPFVGTVDEFNVTYRQRLLDVSMTVVMNNPWLGSFSFLSAPELQEMIQGQGIIDIVNSYIGVALAQGLLGLALFVGIFGSAGWAAWQGLRHTVPGSDAHELGRALLAALAGTAVTIATVSSISQIPVVYWLLAGLCIAYQRLAMQGRRAVAPQPVAPGAWQASLR